MIPKNPAEIPPIVLYYILLSYQKYIDNWKKAYIIIPHIRKDNLENLKIQIPDIPTLKKHIAEIEDMKTYVSLLEEQAHISRQALKLKITNLIKAH